MARSVNVWTSNWGATGNTVPVPQYKVDVTLQWTTNDGEVKERSETIRFPNFLQNVGAKDLKRWLTELMLREARQRLGVDE
jgi:hypothetical protein